MKSLRPNLRLGVLLPTAVLALLGIGFGAFAFSGTPGGAEAPLPPVNHAAGATGKAKKATASSSVTRAAWAKKASAICVHLNRATAQLGTPQTSTDLTQRLPASLDLADAALTELRALDAPARDAARVTRMLDLFARFVALERRGAQALAGDDAETFSRFTARAFAANDRGNELARDLGVPACGKGGTDDTKLASELARHRVVVAVLYAPDSMVDALAIREARAGAGLVDAGFVAVNVFDAKAIAPVTARYTVRESPSIFVFTRAGGAVTRFPGYVDRDTVAQAVGNVSP